jgi:hypothetical protein
MIPVSKITEAESKDLHSLTSEDLLILKYWTTYRECNLWYTLMKACQCAIKSLDYAKKGKYAALQTIQFQNEFIALQDRKFSNEETKTYITEDINIKANEAKLKMLELLLLNGSISKSVYNEKCNQFLKTA